MHIVISTLLMTAKKLRENLALIMKIFTPVEILQNLQCKVLFFKWDYPNEPYLVYMYLLPIIMQVLVTLSASCIDELSCYRVFCIYLQQLVYHFGGSVTKTSGRSSAHNRSYQLIFLKCGGIRCAKYFHWFTVPRRASVCERLNVRQSLSFLPDLT